MKSGEKESRQVIQRFLNMRAFAESWRFDDTICFSLKESSTIRNNLLVADSS